MKHIHVRNLEKYQDGYKDRRHYWAKIYIDMIMYDPQCVMISEIDFSRLVKLIVMETCTKKPQPANEAYLSRLGFDFGLRSLEQSLQELSHFIEIIDVTETVENRNESLRSSVENRYVEKSREEKSRGAFTKPTLQEATDCLKAGGLDQHIDAAAEAQRFLDYYDSVGWVVGKSRKPMKNWRGAISTWLHNRREWRGHAEVKNPNKKLRGLPSA